MLSRASRCAASPDDVLCSAAGRSSAGVATVWRVVGLERLVPLAVAEHREEHRVERLHLRRVGHEHRARRPVQAAAARPGLTSAERPGEVGRARRRHRQPGVVQPRAQRRHERRQVEVDGLHPEVGRGGARVSHRRGRGSSRPAARMTSWSSPYLSTEPSVRLDGRGVQLLDAEQAQRPQPVDRLGDAGRLLHVAGAHARDRVRDLDGQRSATSPARGGARSRPRAAASGSRSSGRGSGA